GHGNATGQIMDETIKKKLALDIVAVPYASNPPAITDLIGNGLQLAGVDMLNGVPLVEARKIVPLAVASKARNPRLPSIPTLHETLIPGFEVLPWVGLFGPPNLPRDITEKCPMRWARFSRTRRSLRGCRKWDRSRTTCRARRLRTSWQRTFRS